MYRLFWGFLFLYILFIYISISIIRWDSFLLVAQVAFLGGSFKYVFAPTWGNDPN